MLLQNRASPTSLSILRNEANKANGKQLHLSRPEIDVLVESCGVHYYGYQEAVYKGTDLYGDRRFLIFC